MRISGNVKAYTDTAILLEAAVPADIQNRVDRCGTRCELELVDSRRLSGEQRKKIYAMFGEVADFMGEIDFGGLEYVKNFLKGLFIEAVKEDKGYGWFSLSNCSMELATEFIHFIIEFCLEHHIPTRDTLLHRYEDIERYMWACLKYKRCAICNEDGEVHHVDVIGMGNNRQTMNDAIHRKICLCRKHHRQAHNMGWPEFAEKYHVVGVIYKE
jgi:hypothetical protein